MLATVAVPVGVISIATTGWSRFEATTPADVIGSAVSCDALPLGKLSADVRLRLFVKLIDVGCFPAAGMDLLTAIKAALM